MASASRRPTRLRVGDQVQVTTGAHLGDGGKILRFSKDGERVFVEGVNKVSRHEKPVPALGKAGGIIEKEAGIHISNVALVLGGGGTTRLAARTLDSGEKIRTSRKTGEQV